MKPTLRLYEPGDAAAVAKLFRDTVHRVNCRDYTAAQIAAWAPDTIGAADWQQKLAGRYCVIVTLADEIVGFGDLADGAYLDHLYVHADHQACGVGKQLVSALEEEIARRGFSMVTTDASITARPFFERRGYRVVREQLVSCRGATFTNFRMEKRMEDGDGDGEMRR